jgi:hypothetical protein
VEHNVVSGGRELIKRELILAALDFLHAHDVNDFANEVVGHSLYAGANRVHVPRSNAHESKVAGNGIARLKT